MEGYVLLTESVDVSPYQQVFRFAFKSGISRSSCTQHIAICMITMEMAEMMMRISMKGMRLRIKVKRSKMIMTRNALRSTSEGLKYGVWLALC